MLREITVSVRALAEFSLQTGDIALSVGMLERMNEGALGHRQLQSMLGPGWVAEEPLTRSETVEGTLLTLQGRADAVCRGSDPLCVLEIKTTQSPPGSIGIGAYPTHLAQGMLYAYILCAENGLPEAEVRLCYYRISDRQSRVHTRRFSFEALRSHFRKLAVPYVAWQQMLEAWREESCGSLASMAFPFSTFRQGQEEMAECVYRAMSDPSQAIIEAPTGIGKTAAALFGALRALSEGRVTALFYLTARTTGRLSACRALELFQRSGAHVRFVVITAKDRCCLLDKRDCPGCPYASDYYRRRREVLKEAMGMEALDEEAIRGLALDHSLCPYELSLDLSEQADVIICDYNYVFDPRVHLRRYFDRRSGAGLLIDEAHNLADRASDMLSATLSCERVTAIAAEVLRFEGPESPTLRSMAPMIAELSDESVEEQCLEKVPEGILRAVQIFVDAGEDRFYDPGAAELFLDASWFLRLARSMRPERTRFLVTRENRGLRARVWCYDPVPHLRKVFSRVGGVALFSGTITPMEHYTRSAGLSPDADQLRLPSPFPYENCLKLRLPVSVRYSDRDRTLETVVRILEAAVRAHTGNYLCCFPSFAYLEKAYRLFLMACPDLQAVKQEPVMTQRAREAFLENFQSSRERSLAAFIVLGGVFSEGIDLPGDRLSGAVIVSTGIPQISFERSTLAELLDDGFGQGNNAAYVYPGLRRVLQAAGRVIRTEEDRGVILFVDSRYDDHELLEWMPDHLRPRRVRKMELLKRRLEDFWNHEI